MGRGFRVEDHDLMGDVVGRGLRVEVMGRESRVEGGGSRFEGCGLRVGGRGLRGES